IDLVVKDQHQEAYQLEVAKLLVSHASYFVWNAGNIYTKCFHQYGYERETLLKKNRYIGGDSLSPLTLQNHKEWRNLKISYSSTYAVCLKEHRSM
ncbi:hypothetical protein L9F63_019846, partial [Diploptera punctata]